jgi:hypothetical protein
MVPLQLIFVVTVALTVTSGIAAIAIVTFGNTRDNAGQTAVAEEFAQIALIGMGAIVAIVKLAQ